MRNVDVTSKLMYTQSITLRIYKNWDIHIQYVQSRIDQFVDLKATIYNERVGTV